MAWENNPTSPKLHWSNVASWVPTIWWYSLCFPGIRSCVIPYIQSVQEWLPGKFLLLVSRYLSSFSTTRVSNRCVLNTENHIQVLHKRLPCSLYIRTLCTRTHLAHTLLFRGGKTAKLSKKDVSINENFAKQETWVAFHLSDLAGPTVSSEM